MRGWVTGQRSKRYTFLIQPHEEQKDLVYSVHTLELLCKEANGEQVQCVCETKVSWGERKGGFLKKEHRYPTCQYTVITVRGTLTLDSLPSKNKNKIDVRRCFFTAHTLILQKGHYKHFLHLQKALNGATEIYAGGAPPGRVKEKSSWDEVIQINWTLGRTLLRVGTRNLVRLWTAAPTLPWKQDCSDTLHTGLLWHEGQDSNPRASS